VARGSLVSPGVSRPTDGEALGRPVEVTMAEGDVTGTTTTLEAGC
jgi:hypothetical protein